MSSPVKCRSYAFTLRPLDGITDSQISTFSKWVRKQAAYYHIVTEKTGSARHIHSGFILHKDRPRSNVLQMLQRLYPELSVTEQSVMRKGLRIMYNWDFVNNYLSKGDDTVIIDSSLPEEGHLEAFFPPKPTPKENTSKKCSLYYHELEVMWYKYMPVGSEVNTRVARDFLFKVMYAERCLPVIRDDKQIIQTARHLVRWLKKSEESVIELPVFEKEE